MSKDLGFDIVAYGADDPEMRRIVEILNERNIPCLPAKKNGDRVHAGNAYEADNTEDFIGKRVLIIECAFVADKVDVVRVIDHHRPGMPGDHAHMDSEQFWEASSLARILAIFGQDDRVLAAMDHCFNKAVQGLCPGVTSEEVLEMKIRQIAKGTGVSDKEAMDAIDLFRSSLGSFPSHFIGNVEVMMIEPGSIGYSLEYLTAQVAAVLEKRAILLAVKDSENEQTRLHLCGDVKAETIDHFLNVWAPCRGLEKLYGSPARGYAGGYVKKE